MLGFRRANIAVQAATRQTFIKHSLHLNSIRFASTSTGINESLTNVPEKLISAIDKVRQVTPEGKIDYTVAIDHITANQDNWFKPVVYTMEAVQSIHEWSGQPYWIAIAALFTGLRLAVVPLTFAALRTGAGAQIYRHELAQAAAAVKEAGNGANAMDARKAYMAIMKKANISITAPLVSMLGNLVLILPAFAAMRKFGTEGHLFPDYVFGGPEFCPLLHLPDPTYTLPTLQIGLSIASVFLNRAMAGFPQFDLTENGQKVMMSSLALAFGGITFILPAGIQMLGVITAASFCLQHLSLRSLHIRRFLKFPEGWPLDAAGKKSLCGGNDSSS